MRRELENEYTISIPRGWLSWGVLIFAFINIFAVSGFAQQFNFNQACGWVSIIFLIFTGYKFLTKFRYYQSIVSALFYFFFIIWAVIACLNFNDSHQIINLVTLFGMPIWIVVLASFNWEDVDIFKIGIAISTIASSLIFLFLPGNLFSGWNPNSPIFVIPLILCGFGCISASTHNFSKFWCIVFGIIDLYLLLALGNRSAVLAVLIFFVGYCFPLFYRKRKIFIICAIALIIFNVGAPLFQNFITNSEIYRDTVAISTEMVKKSGGLNGREGIWLLALKIIDLSPLLGSGGSRIMGIYFHNFSIDVLIQFGWLGWIYFFSALVYVLNKSFVENSNYNIFLWSFLSILLLNTFENALVDNNYFTIFPYLLLALPMYFNHIDLKRN